MNYAKRFCLLFFMVLIFTAAAFCEESQPSTVQSAPEENTKKNSYFASRGEIRTSIFSLDLSYLLNALKNNGVGIGARYERYFSYHLAGQAHFGHSLFFVEGKVIPAVTLGLFAECYPFREGLDGFYVVFGSTLDYVAFSLIPNVMEGVEQTYISIYPMLGYKLRIFKWMSADFFLGYKYSFINTEKYPRKKIEDYIGSGFKFGISLKFHFY